MHYSFKITHLLCLMLLFLTASLSAQRSQVISLKLDKNLIAKGRVFPGSKDFLQEESVVTGADCKDSLTAFTIGLIDYNGNGIFNESGIDRYFLTIYKDRKLRINNTWGTPCALFISGSKPLIVVDTFAYILQSVDPEGNTIQLMPVPRHQAGVANLQIQTHLPFVDVKSARGGNINTEDCFHKGKNVYIYFWVSVRVPIQIEKLDEIQRRFEDRVQIVGMNYPDLEFEPNLPNYLEELAKPWPQGVCDRELFKTLQQDASWFRGILADENGRILEISISPKELCEKLETNR